MMRFGAIYRGLARFGADAEGNHEWTQGGAKLNELNGLNKLNEEMQGRRL